MGNYFDTLFVIAFCQFMEIIYTWNNLRCSQRIKIVCFLEQKISYRVGSKEEFFFVIQPLNTIQWPICVKYVLAFSLLPTFVLLSAALMNLLSNYLALTKSKIRRFKFSNWFSCSLNCETEKYLYRVDLRGFLT